MVIIKIDIIKGYTIKVYISAMEFNKTRVLITKGNIIIRKYSIIKVFNHLTRNKPISNKC